MKYLVRFLLSAVGCLSLSFSREAFAQEFVYVQVQVGEPYVSIPNSIEPLFRKILDEKNYDHMMSQSVDFEFAENNALQVLASLPGVEWVQSMSGVSKTPVRMPIDNLKPFPTQVEVSLHARFLTFRLQKDVTTLPALISKIYSFVKVHSPLYQLHETWTSSDNIWKPASRLSFEDSRLKYLLDPATVDRYFEPIRSFDGLGDINFIINASEENEKLSQIRKIMQKFELGSSKHFVLNLENRTVLRIHFWFDPETLFAWTRLSLFAEELLKLDSEGKNKNNSQSLVVVRHYDEHTDSRHNLSVLTSTLYEGQLEQWDHSPHSGCFRYFSF